MLETLLCSYVYVCFPYCYFRHYTEKPTSLDIMGAPLMRVFKSFGTIFLWSTGAFIYPQWCREVPASRTFLVVLRIPRGRVRSEVRSGLPKYKDASLGAAGILTWSGVQPPTHDRISCRCCNHLEFLCVEENIG